MATRSRGLLLRLMFGMLPLVLPWGGVAAASEAMDDAAGQCRERIKVSDWQGAVLACSRAIEKDPKLTTAWIDRCQAQLELARLGEAMADCRRAVQLDPRNSEAYLRLADVKAASNPLDDRSVLEDYDKSIILDPRNATAYNNRGVTRNSLKNYMGALDDYNKAIELDPGNSLYYFNRGETLFLKGQRELGCSSFRQGHDLKPDFTLTTPDFDSAYLKFCNQIKEPVQAP